MIEDLDHEPNYRAIVFIIIFLGACLYFIIPVFTQTPEGFYKDASGNSVKIPEGFIKAENGTPIPLIIPTPIIITNTVYVTPTPDDGIYYVSEIQNGTRKLGRYFTYHRNDVLGYKDLDAHVTVYGYKILDSYHWFNWQDYNYYETIPDGYPDTKFVFIYVQYYTDVISGGDVRNWLPDEWHYFINYKGSLYSPIAFEQALRIYELEETFNLNDDHRIEYYGQKVVQPLWGVEAGKPRSEQALISYGGKSNAVDGYIVYILPKEAQPADMMVMASFDSFGSSEWVLKT